jgi:hypothetical protein
MPVKSKKQWKWLAINHPDLLHKWQKEAPVKFSDLPEDEVLESMDQREYNYTLSFSKKYDLPLGIVQDKYNLAKQISIDDKGKEDFNYIDGILKSMYNIKEEIYNKGENRMDKRIYEFLNSDKKAKEFLEEACGNYSKKEEDAQVSTSLGNISTADHEINPSKDMKIYEADPSLQAPKEWWDEKIKDIKGTNPEAILGRIWSDLSDSKKSEIRARYGKTYGKAEKEEAIDGDVNPTIDPSISYRGHKGGDPVVENVGGGDDGSTPKETNKDDKKPIVK